MRTDGLGATTTLLCYVGSMQEQCVWVMGQKLTALDMANAMRAQEDRREWRGGGRQAMLCYQSLWAHVCSNGRNSTGGGLILEMHMNGFRCEAGQICSAYISVRVAACTNRSFMPKQRASCDPMILIYRKDIAQNARVLYNSLTSAHSERILWFFKWCDKRHRFIVHLDNAIGLALRLLWRNIPVGWHTTPFFFVNNLAFMSL